MYSLAPASLLLLLLLAGLHLARHAAHAISIKPADFDRLVMPCYLGGSYSSASSYSSAGSYGQSSQGFTALGRAPASQPASSFQAPYSSSGLADPSLSGLGNQQQQQQQQRLDTNNQQLGQQVPRANTIDNFIALVSKLEAASPRLASNPDQLIRSLLGRFRLDNYYYDVRARTPISEQDHRVMNIVPALLGPSSAGFNPAHQQYGLAQSDVDFPEHLLSQDEKCSMYFMLSHFIEKRAAGGPPLASMPASQLSGPLNGQRPPSLQAAGAGYPALSANQAFGGQERGGSRYPGPAPAFGSPATANMNSFGQGLSNQPDPSSGTQYGMGVLQPNPMRQQQQSFGSGGFASSQSFGQSASQRGYVTPFIDGGGRGSRGEQPARASEFGVVTVANQPDAALVLNRVLMGLLAAGAAPRTMRQLAETIYPTQNLLTTSPRLDNNLDPLYALTLADLWAVSAIPKADKPLILGDNGRWNDTMCPTNFQLDRPNSIRFTTAELLGGLDGLQLGLLRRELMERRKSLRLSDLLRMYYSKAGFRGQFAEVGVCNRASAVNSHLEELKRQAEDYLRLHQLNVPTNDNEISSAIQRLDSFKELLRQAAQQYAPQELCLEQDSLATGNGYANNNGECELAKADMVAVLDVSPEANEPFMRLVVAKLAQKVGLSRVGSSLTVLTNQQDATGYAGSYSFNAILTNSTNTAEVGCALQQDQSRSYSGGQVNEPTRLVEMFERALVNLDSEYLLRQNMGSTGSNYNSNSQSSRQSTYASSWFGTSGDTQGGQGGFYSPNNAGGGPKSTGGAKAIIWFNFGHQPRQNSLASFPTNWNDPKYGEQNQYKFQEAKRYLRENFRGASILAVASNRDEVKPFVFDEERDIFSDIPSSSSSSQVNQMPDSQYISTNQMDPSTVSMLSGPADQLVQRLLQRMCDIPATFQYPMCFRQPSDQTPATGYISPQRKQYWMMSPKTFFSSRSVRMAFKVEGGRLRVCFGRMSHPDESAQRNGQVLDSSGAISLMNPAGGSSPYNNNNNNRSPLTSSSSGNNYQTGMDSGICKDLAPGQEVDFVVDDPCYKKPIAECEPFYFVIKEISNPGEGDINYMCRDEGCRRLDQVKFTMTHSGITCNAASYLKGNWLLIMISTLVVSSIGLNTHNRAPNHLKSILRTCPFLLVTILLASLLSLLTQQAQAQQAGVHDFGQNRYGELRGNLTPSEVLALILLVMTILAGLALAIGLCYYVYKQEGRSNRSGMTQVKQSDY